jgi:ribosomal protein S18 acetylase RimI-like enzyme
MDQDVEIVVMDSPDEAMLDAVESLLRRLYDFMEAGGLMLPLAPDGSGKWRHGVAAGLGRFGTLVVARDKSDGRIVGFVQGSLRRVPDYLGNKWTGFIPHVFVLPEYRGTGCGARMVEAALEWFGRHRVDSVELQVLVENESAIRFWKGHGFAPELLQMRRKGP